MSNLARAIPHMTPQEYFAFEEKTPLKHEYVDGFVYAMVGATDRHNLVALNLATALRAARPAGCQVFMSDMKLKVRLMAAERITMGLGVISYNNAVRFLHLDANGGASQ